MKKIPLTRGKFAIVDDNEYSELNQFKWYAWKNKKQWYARRNLLKHEGIGAVAMHRVIMKICDPKLQVDHRDHNGLNNQKRNLRVCNTSQNVANQLKSIKKGGSSKYKGVHLKKYPFCKRWIAQIWTGTTKVHLGSFKTQKDAAKCYNSAAIKYYGEFACLNNI
jgi:hypothetical protein